MPDEEEWEIIYQCTADRGSTLRTDAAEILWIRCNEKDEERLRQMTSDKIELVSVTNLWKGDIRRKP